MTTCPDCGKPLYEDSIHSCFPLALYLAEQIEAVYEDERMLPLKAAAELRRLHAENEALKQALKLMGVDDTTGLEAPQPQRDEHVDCPRCGHCCPDDTAHADTALLRQALEALDYAYGCMPLPQTDPVLEAIAALKERLK